jgi:hypothetical protein
MKNVEERMRRLFERCPTLHRFSVRDRAGLPDHVDPTALTGEMFIFEIALFPRYGKKQYDEVYDLIARALADAVSAEPASRRLLPGRSFVRALH